MKVPGYDIFKLKNLFIPININDNHWACIVKYIVEKQVEYNDSKGIGT
jgi:Ulp1 family protease